MTRLAGVGLGLRWEFLEEVLDGPTLDVAFFEVSPENYMRRGGWYPAALERIADRYPLVTHGLTLSLGGSEPPASGYLDELRAEVTRLGSPWHSDHLCWTSTGDRVLHELLPVKHCERTVSIAADNLRRTQDILGVPMALENISWYAHCGAPEMSEEELICRILERSGAGLLLDVNNVYVNSQNHGFDPRRFIDALPLERVVQLHVAGHTRVESGLLIDTHGATTPDPVLELLAFTVQRTGPVPVLLERDNFIPPLPELLAEVATVRGVYDAALTRREAWLAASA